MKAGSSRQMGSQVFQWVLAISVNFVASAVLSKLNEADTDCVEGKGMEKHQQITSSDLMLKGSEGNFLFLYAYA